MKRRFTSFLFVAFILTVSIVLVGQKNPLLATSFIAAQTSITDESQAVDAVWRIPEVQQKAREIERLSNGRTQVKLVVESEPNPSEPYYTIRVFEDHPEHIVTLYWFRVASPEGVVTVQDFITGEYISLEEWRKKL